MFRRILGAMIGTTLSHYRILEPLGQGGMGEVYRAHDLHLDRDVAIKVLLSGALADPTARDRFRREAHVLSRLSHPGVATIFDFDTQDRLDFLVMEYVPGGTLQSRLGEGAMGLDELMRLGAEIGDALEAAHRLGFLHRDLKPGNVVLTATGMPKILDFGLAGLLHTSHTATDLTRAGAVFGSLPYMAPEQVRGEEGDSRTDVYAFGVILYEMATGRRPYAESGAVSLRSLRLPPLDPPVVSAGYAKPPRANRNTGAAAATPVSLATKAARPAAHRTSRTSRHRSPPAASHRRTGRDGRRTRARITPSPTIGIAPAGTARS